MSMLKLYSIAFKNRIKIVRKDIDGGYAKPEINEVVIPKDIFHTETRQTLAHELGHCLHPLGYCAPKEERFMVNAVGMVTDNILRQEFAAWEWAADHTKIDSTFMFKSLWSYANKVRMSVVESVGNEFETVWKMCQGFLPVDEPERNPYTMFDIRYQTKRQVDEMLEYKIPNFDYEIPTNTTATVYGKEKSKRVISAKKLDEILSWDMVMDWERIEETMKKYTDISF